MRKLTFEEFKSRSLKLHNNKYIYPEQSFINTNTKVKIFCKRCNIEFYQIPSTHLLGKGHKNCSLRKSSEKFLFEAHEKYGNKFIYDLSEYEKSTSYITVTCNDCGFISKQKSITHLNSTTGCPKCGRTRANQSITKSFISFVEKSVQRNGDIFIFNPIEFPFQRKSILEVICRFCNNIFKSDANTILNKSGCPSCSHNSKHPDTEGFVYQLLYNNQSIFYVGITTCSLKIRLRRHKDAVKYRKSNTILFNFLKDKDLNLLSMQELEKGKAFELAKKEDFWITKLNTKYPIGLNKNKGGSGLNLKYINND